ncbi:MAG: APC family permease [Vicinamibacterales bacterium]|nr:APC family permease [Vicinamibacterales bacterium]
MTTPALRRELGRWDLTAIGINQVVGSGIFLLPAAVAAQVGAWGPGVFIFVGLTCMLIGLCFAEVGSRFDSTGGPIVPARAAFGRFVGFEVGWMMWFTRVASWASVMNGLALALAFYWPSLAGGAPKAALFIGLTAVLSWINIRGVRQGAWVVNVLTVAKLVPLVLFIVVGIWYISPGNFQPWPEVTAPQFGQTALILIFAYGGFEVIGIPAGEASDPRRHVPFAMVATITVVMVIYTMVSIVSTGTLPGLAESATPLADAAALALGAAGALLISSGAAISMTGNCAGQVISSSRTIFALGENGDLPAWFARVHPVWRTPVNAIVFSSTVTLALALSGSFVLLAAVSAVARLFIYATTCLATLALRRPGREATVADATFVVAGGAIVPVIALIVSLGILWGATPDQLLRGAAAFIVGGLLFLVASRAESARPPRAESR